MHGLLQIHITIHIDDRRVIIYDITLMVAVDDLIDVLVDCDGMRKLAVVEIDTMSRLFFPILISILRILDALIGEFLQIDLVCHDDATVIATQLIDLLNGNHDSLVLLFGKREYTLLGNPLQRVLQIALVSNRVD